MSSKRSRRGSASPAELAPASVANVRNTFAALRPRRVGLTPLCAPVRRSKVSGARGWRPAPRNPKLSAWFGTARGLQLGSYYPISFRPLFVEGHHHENKCHLYDKNQFVTPAVAKLTEFYKTNFAAGAGTRVVRSTDPIGSWPALAERAL